jgi:hypothetical protein
MGIPRSGRRMRKQCLKKDGTCYVTFSHHDPQKKNLDLNFFTFLILAFK